MAYIYDIADTWSWGGAFTAIKMNVTDSGSTAGSLLMDLQVGGSSKFGVSKDGNVYLQGGVSTHFIANSNGGGLACNNGGFNDGSYDAVYTGYGTRFGSSASVGWASSSTVGANGGAPDLHLARDAANTLAQRNGVNAQASRIYGTYTDASNYRRLTKTMSTGGVAEIKPEGAGTGASGNVLHISGLPTSNPGAGILWNNLGAVVVGT